MTPKTTLQSNPSTDNYTARMDRMIVNLKSKSQKEHSRQNQILWASLAGIALFGIIIYLAVITIQPESLQGLENLLWSRK